MASSAENERRLREAEEYCDQLRDFGVTRRIVELETRMATQDSNWTWLWRTIFASVFLAFVAALVITALRAGGGP